ncbi:MAG: type I restriction enzyme HsdR N-terminal domain-containing protein [Chitinophagaceae bacterium]
MIKIAYPEPAFRTRNHQGQMELFDEIRKIWVKITPEEWVRQNFIQWLIKSMKYPSALMAVEKELSLGELKKRFDVLIYNSNHRPWMMIECKAPEVELSEKTIMQILRYNMSIPVTYLVVTNGHYCFAASIIDGKAEWINELPAYS